MTKSMKLLASVLVLVGVGVGLKYFYVNPKVEKGVSEVLKENNLEFSKVSCSGLLSTNCRIDSVSQKGTGLKIKQIDISDVQQFAPFADKNNNGPIDLDLDITLKGIKVQEASRDLVFLAQLYRVPFNPSIIPLVMEKGDIHITGKIHYENRDLKKFEKFGIDINNNFLPFSLYLSGENKKGLSIAPMDTSLKEIYLKANFSKKAKLVKFVNNNVFRLYRSPKDVDKIVSNLEKEALKEIQKEKKLKNKSFQIKGEDELLTALEKIAKEDANIIDIALHFPNDDGVTIRTMFNDSELLKKISITADTE